MNLTDSPYVEQYYPNDVLITHEGVKINPNHEGNVKFLKLVVQDYSNHENDWSRAKTLASAKRVFRKVRSQNPPGRFLKLAVDHDGRGADPTSKQRWQILSRGEALAVSWSFFDKVKQGLEKKRKNSIEQSSEETKKSKTMLKESEKLNETNQIVIEIDSDESFCKDDDTSTVPVSSKVSALSFNYLKEVTVFLDRTESK